jgi:hypothetical protein
MTRIIGRDERIAEKNAAKTQFRRNSSRSGMRQPMLLHRVTRIRIAAEHPMQNPKAAQFRTRRRSRYMTLPYCKKLTEVALTLKAINEASARENPECGPSLPKRILQPWSQSVRLCEQYTRAFRQPPLRDL